MTSPHATQETKPKYDKPEKKNYLTKMKKEKKNEIQAKNEARKILGTSVSHDGS